MKATVTKFTLTYAREAHLKSQELQRTFLADAQSQTEGVFDMALPVYRRLYRKYSTRSRQCARRYHRKSKNIRRLMTTSDNW